MSKARKPLLLALPLALTLCACGSESTPQYYDKDGNELDEATSLSLERTKAEREAKVQARTNPTAEQFLKTSAEDRRRILSIKNRNGVALTPEEASFLENGVDIVSSEEARQITDERNAALKAREARIRAAISNNASIKQ